MKQPREKEPTEKQRRFGTFVQHPERSTVVHTRIVAHALGRLSKLGCSGKEMASTPMDTFFGQLLADNF